MIANCDTPFPSSVFCDSILVANYIRVLIVHECAVFKCSLCQILTNRQSVDDLCETGKFNCPIPI